MPAPKTADSSTLHARAIAAFQRGDAATALAQIARACAEPDAPVLHHCHHAEILFRRGRREDAEAVARRTTARWPDSPEAWDMLGTLLADRGALEEARDSFRNALRLDPGQATAHNNLALALQRLGEPEPAETHFRQAIALAPGALGIQLNLAVLLKAQKRDLEALAAATAILVRAPDALKALMLAADCERSLGRDPDALVRLDRALALAPGDPDVLKRRALILCRLARWDAALAESERTLAVAPGDPAGLHTRALALQGLDRGEEALHAFRLAAAARPGAALVVVHGAVLLSELGRRTEALAELDRALALQPNLTDAWYARAGLTRYVPGHPDLARMEALADEPSASGRDRTYLSYALGKAYLQLGDGEQAFARLAEGAQLKRATVRYDSALEERAFEAIAATWSPEFLSERQGAGEPSERPVFVFGMPRSGTTLVEHILASHPEVHGAGESERLPEIMEAENLALRGPALRREDFTALGRLYLERVGATAPETARRIIDKAPLNFMHAGPIALMLPGARMIHCRRDPLDTCLSAYSMLFTRGHEYSYDFQELGHFHRLYRALMAHWREALPAERLLEVDYEALVASPETQIRAIVEFCGLPWDERCLRFHETPRRVASASLDQVRSPIYTASVGRAQRFRPWLEELEAAL